MTLQTAVDPAVPGTKIRVEGGIILKLVELKLILGGAFNISVENLSFNTPARLKFMSSIPSEVAHVKEIVTSIGPGLSGNLLSLSAAPGDEALVHTLRMRDYEQTLEQIFVPPSAKSYSLVAGEHGPIRLTGFRRPNIAWGNRGQ